MIKENKMYAKNNNGYETIEVPLEVKAEDVNEDGTFKGWASTFGGSADSHGDIIEQGAFQDTIEKGGRNGNGIAMLYQHMAKEPIGVWTSLVENKKGLRVEGQLAMDVQRAKETHSLMRMGALKGLSIGWDFPRDKSGDRDPDSFEIIEKPKARYGYIRKLKKIVLWEISPVTFPANTRTAITTVKDFQRCKTPRQLEQQLRESGVSKASAQYIVGLCKGSLRESENIEEEVMVDSTMLDILEGLKQRNLSISDF